MKAFFTSKITSGVLLILHGFGLLVLTAEYGFSFPKWLEPGILLFYIILLSISIAFTTGAYFFSKKDLNVNILIFDLLSLIFIGYCVHRQFDIHDTTISNWIRYAVLLVLIRVFATPRISYKRSFLTPARLFIFSFLALILLGTFLLMLPRATLHGISLVDALFTSTSAVCVNGLVVVNTSSFTRFGQTIIMLLIQAGGLGILTFASYFSYFFKGGATYENQIALNDISNTGKLGDVFTTLGRILVITFWVEFFGAILIFINLDPAMFPSYWNRVYFSIFHSISSFCNAGFSTMPEGLMNEGLVDNYPLQLVIIALFVFGGLGFPIVINVVRYVNYVVTRYFLWFVSGKTRYKPWILTLSSKINLITTFSLTLTGTLFIYIMESDNVLSVHEGLGKFTTALFTATTPRTAGYNTIDFRQLHFSSLMLIIMFMWIGASPASTGGGIKTSTFAIAILNAISLAKGKTKIEIFRREIADISVRRAFATMTLSLVVIGFAILFIARMERRIPLPDIIFECFSAYSTTGLSLGVTADLSDWSKLALMTTMFTGRVTMLSVLIALFRKVRTPNYRYPTDEIMIN